MKEKGKKGVAIQQAQVLVTTVMTRVMIRKPPKRIKRREERQRNKRRRSIMNKTHQRARRNTWK